MSRTKNGYTTIVFDLTGVIFKVNKLDMCKRLGLWRTFWYVLTHRKNPVDLYLNTLNALERLSAHTAENNDQMRFGDISFPASITEYFTGKKTGRQTAYELHAGIQTLYMEHYFASQQERALVDHVVSRFFINDKNASGFIPIKKSIEIIKKLKGSYRLLLLSNFDKETFAQLYTRYRPIFDLFDGMVISGQVGLLKPYKPVYQHLLNSYKITAEETIFVDDQEENLREPRKMGLKTILYKKHSQLLRELQTYTSVKF